MKKLGMILLFGSLVMSLVACSTKTVPVNTTGEVNATSEQQPGLSELNSLAVGIFKLVGTDHDVTNEQAKELVVLWKAYNQVTDSDTASPEEKDALVKQIQSTLTTEQNAAIQNMSLTAQDVTRLMQEQGISAKVAQKSSSGSSSSSRGMGGPGGFPGGGMPGGGPMDGGVMSGGGMAATPAAGQSANRTAMGGFVTENMTRAIIDALIKILETRTA